MAIQIIITIFVLFALSRVYLQFKSDNVTTLQFIFWLIIWLGVLTVLYWPNLSNQIAEFLGISRGVDVFVYLGIIALFYLIYRAYIKIEHLERDITKIVRKEALKELDKNSV